MVSVNKLFVGFNDAEKWLNTQGEKSLLLTSVSDGKYTFTQSDTPVKYYIDHTDDSPFTEKNKEYIDSRLAEGFSLACISGRTLYFYTAEEKKDYSSRFKNMLSNVRLVLLSSVTVFLFSMGIMLYEMKQMQLLANATFEGITPRTVALIALVPAAVSLGISVMYGIEFATLYKKKKEALLNEQSEQQDQAEQGS